jgi:hypothetical protein
MKVLAQAGVSKGMPLTTQPINSLMISQRDATARKTQEPLESITTMDPVAVAARG